MVKLDITKSSPMCLLIETLKRIGHINPNTKIIYPLAYVIDRGDGYYIAHFRELFSLVKDEDYQLSDDDNKNLMAVVSALVQWNLIIVDGEFEEVPVHRVSILRKDVFKNDGWCVEHKFNMLDFILWRKK